MFDFDAFVDRNGTGCAKWDYRADSVKKAGTIPLSTADMEFRCAPAIIKAAHEAAERGIYGYTDGDDAYYSALEGFMLRRHNCEIKRDWVVVTNGVVSAIALAVQSLTKHEDAIVMMPPVYGPFMSTAKGCERKMYFNQLIRVNGRYEINFDEFERICSREETKLFMLCNPHNPTGRVWTAEELSRMAKICKDNGVYIVSDEIHLDLILKGYKHTTLLNIPEADGNCIVCTAISKSFNVPGLNCSDIIIREDDVREKIKKQQEINNAEGMSYFARAISIAAHNECDDWLDEVNAYITENFYFMKRFIEERLPMFELTEMEGTYLAWLDMRALGLSDKELAEFKNEKACISIAVGDWFGIGGSGFTRWNIALPRKALQDALEHLEKAVNELYAQRR